jgi:hypothetical protein
LTTAKTKRVLHVYTHTHTHTHTHIHTCIPTCIHEYIHAYRIKDQTVIDTTKTKKVSPAEKDARESLKMLVCMYVCV